MLLEKIKKPDVEKLLEEKGDDLVVIVPIGSLEQHGNHLPLNTDMVGPEYVAAKAAEKTGDLVAPSVKYGYNEKELMFKGTVSIKAMNFINYVVDIGESLGKTGFKKILLLNGHGLNVPLLQTASNMINERIEGWCMVTSFWNLIGDKINELREGEIPGGMGHGGEFETSVQLYLNPDLVNMDLAEKEISFIKTGYTWHDLFNRPPIYVMNQFDYISKSGVIGDPTLASAEKGEEWLNLSVQSLVDFLGVFKEKY